MTLVTAIATAVSAGFPAAFTRVEANDYGVYGIVPPGGLSWMASGERLVSSPPSVAGLAIAAPSAVGTTARDEEPNSTPTSVGGVAPSDPSSGTAAPGLTASDPDLAQHSALAIARLPSSVDAASVATALSFRELQEYQASFADGGATRAVHGGQTQLQAATRSGDATGDPSAVRSAVRAAVQYEAAGNLKAAINAYHQALQLDETDRMALIGFSRLKHRLGDLDGAIVTCRQSLKHHPNDAVALNDLAICYARMGQFDAATESLRTALNLDPASRRYINNLAKVLVERGNDREAWQLLTAEYGEALANYNLGFIHLHRSAYEVAAGYFRETLDLDPSFAPATELLRQLGEAGYESPAEPDLAIKQAGVCTLEASPASDDYAAEAPDPQSLPLANPEIIREVHIRQQHCVGSDLLQ